MAVSFIEVNVGRVLGVELLKAAHEARELGQRVAALKSIMDGMTDGTDTTVLETQFGLPPGRGADVAYMITVLKSGLDGLPQFHLLADWFGQT